MLIQVDQAKVIAGLNVTEGHICPSPIIELRLTALDSQAKSHLNFKFHRLCLCNSRELGSHHVCGAPTVNEYIGSDSANVQEDVNRPLKPQISSRLRWHSRDLSMRLRA